jgi:asparagine synthase (glutamine-hydrolysing)
MCGIAGIVAFSDIGRQQVPKLQQSIRTLQTRGPDDEGIYTAESIGLAQRRLSIIDTSKAANQPMWDHTGRYCMVYNGEIFNFRELQQKHFTPEEQKQFRTHSDTEVLLELFVKKGTACLSLLEGFFALAVYDTSSGELVLARDRFGKKPLNYFQDQDQFIFASELKALFTFGIPRKINYEALQLYLQFAYVPQPLCILQHIKKVTPGSYLIFKNGKAEEIKWYHLSVAGDYQHSPSYDDAKKELVKHMEDAVTKRLISDVPLGAFLSGGVDSSVIVALASKHQSSLNTFSIGFRGEQYFDETQYAKLLAQKYKIHHTIITLGVEDYLEHIFDVLNYFDEPFADPSSLPQYILCMETRKHVTVAISGDGGDEVFAGYNKHYAEWQARRHSLMSSLVKMGSPVWKMLPKGRNSKMTNLFRQLHRFAEAASLSSKERYWNWASTFSPAELKKLIKEETIAKADAALLLQLKESFLKEIDEKDFNSVLKTDIDFVLAGDMLVKVDQMSMANSVEVRSPFLDHKVVEYAFTLPAHYKINGEGRKKIVKDAFRHLLPEEIYHRSKQGFEIPMLQWFRNELHAYIFDDLLNEKFINEQGIFHYGFIEELKRKLHSSIPGDIVEQLWVLIVFQHWYKKYFL